MTTIHDSGYKLLFSNRTIFRQLMETFVDQPWVAELDFERAETVDKSFISEEYQKTESDLIYKLPWGGDELYIYVLMEFQSTVDRWMALRMLNYITSFYMDWVKAHPEARRVPPLFPLLLYNGDARWTAAQTMAELVESEPSLGDYAIGFRYFKLAANEFSREQLIGIGNIVSTLFFAESKPDMNLLIEQFVRVFEQSEDKGAISTFFNWFKQLAVHKRLNSADFVSLAEAYRSAEEIQDMLQQTFEKWYQEGVEDGFEKGIEKGREDAIRRTALAMFACGIDPVLIADVTGLSADELNALLTSPPPEDVTP